MRHHKHNTGLNLAVRGLHDELKGLVLTCAANFPKEARGGLKFVADVVDLQGMIASYNRQVLVRIFQSASSAESASVILGTAVQPANSSFPGRNEDGSRSGSVGLSLRLTKTLGGDWVC